MNKTLESVADNIAGTLIREIVGSQRQETVADQQIARPPYQDMVDNLAKMVGQEVASWMERVNADSGGEVRAVLNRLLEVEKKLEKLSSELDSVSSNKESTSLPNLKYAKSKYQNVESLLNYVEKGDDQGGLKLVIMNFND